MFQKPVRPVDRVFIHCSANDNPIFVGEALKKWVWSIHVDQNGWNDIGYHFLIDRDGRVMSARYIEYIPAAQKNHNDGTIAIMVHGLKSFTATSLNALHELCEAINVAYRGKVTFHGHCEVNPHKTCPVFDYSAVLGLDIWSRMPAPEHKESTDA